MKSLVSKKTLENWDRLGVNPSNDQGGSSLKLVSRANKKMSKKRLIPLEYFSNKENMSYIQALTDLKSINDYKQMDVMFSAGVNLLSFMGLADKPHVKEVIEYYKKTLRLIPEILQMSLPADEYDFLGLLYQSIKSEGDRNMQGMYYTSYGVMDILTDDINPGREDKFLDPCCGSGGFLMKLGEKGVLPQQLFGIDIDPIAVMICKINLLLRFPQIGFMPQIFCGDFLSKGFDESMKFDYIITNPPWGSSNFEKEKILVEFPEIKSGEAFSLFLIKSYKSLSEKGIIRFILPESILNVKAHRDIRGFMLEEDKLKGIRFFEENFTGVTTGFISIELESKSDSQRGLKESEYTVDIYRREKSFKVKGMNFRRTEDMVFSILDDLDEKIIDRVFAKGSYTLENSIFALGIVTGDNKGKLKDVMEDGMEEIFTGKEIKPFVLLPARKFIYFDKDKLQQVAGEHIYRSKEKLVYKFIADRPIFAYDDGGRLFLNSANILIPHVPGMSAKTVMAFLNSHLYGYIYKKMFGQIKILKSNLLKMPFPEITLSENLLISSVVDDIIMEKKGSKEYLEDIIFSIFNLDEEAVNRCG